MAGTGLKKETAGALSYVLFMVTGVVFLVLEKDDPFVRFHAMQSIVVFTGLFVLQWIFGQMIFIPFLGQLIGIIIFVLWLILIYKAWQGEEYEVPFVGKIVRQLVSKV